MLSLLFRTLLIYLILFVIMRLMGKRQIGELEVTDLVTTLLLSEIASLPITNQELPVSHAVIPMTILLFLEIAFSVVLIRFPRLKFLVSARPTVIMQNGKLDQSALRTLRISIDELVSEIRQQGYTSIEQIDCAILEKNGKLTILPKPAYGQPTAAQLGLALERDPLMHIVYANGSTSRAGLALIGKSEEWLQKKLRKKRIDPKNTFCVMANSDGEILQIPLKKKKGERK